MRFFDTPARNFFHCEAGTEKNTLFCALIAGGSDDIHVINHSKYVASFPGIVLSYFPESRVLYLSGTHYVIMKNHCDEQMRG